MGNASVSRATNAGTGMGSLRQRSMRLRYVLGLGILCGGVAVAQPLAAPAPLIDTPKTALAGETALAGSDISVMTYNVKGLPWPLADGRGAAMRLIAARLARLRTEGRQPTVVVLQEAFTAEAKAIGDLAGYPFRIDGPYLRDGPGERETAGGRWYRGETQAAELDSGLIILSDLPVTGVSRAPFPTGACAGYDCLAAKGVVMVTLQVPGRGSLAVATTHLNSRAASGAPYPRTHEAYRKQAAFLAGFVSRELPAGVPLIVAGDFNRGQRPVRSAALRSAFGPLREALGERMGEDARGIGRSSDARWIRQRARDMQFLFDGRGLGLDAVAADIPFGTEPGRDMLSDHMGFTIHYRLVPRAVSAKPNRAA